MTATLDEFEHYIHKATPADTEKDCNTKRRKLSHDMCEEKILIKHLTKTLKEEKAKQKWQTETRQTRKNQFRQNLQLDTRNRFAALQNTRDEVLDKEAKNYKEKEILIHRHQTPVYRKQNHRPNPVINNFPENDYPYKEQIQEIVNKVTQCKTVRKRS